MQTALILDALRSAQYALREQQQWHVGGVLLCGHSMGGAGAVVAASKLKASRDEHLPKSPHSGLPPAVFRVHLPASHTTLQLSQQCRAW